MILKIRPFTYRTYIRWVFLRVTKLAKIRNMCCIFILRQYFIGDLKYFLQKILQNKISAYSKKLRFKRYREIKRKLDHPENYQIYMYAISSAGKSFYFRILSIKY